MSNNIAQTIAKELIKVEAIKLQVNKPFTWASGWKSPIYCDNRKTLSYPSLRTLIKTELACLIRQHFPDAECISGVATGAIAQGALVADTLALPFSYIRSAPKDHGMENLIEGELKPGSKVVIVEDLISTGGSSLKAVEAVRKHGAEVVGMVAIYTHGFPDAKNNFEMANVRLITLSDYNAVLEEALQTGYITEEEQNILSQWRQSPSTWGK